MEPALVVLGLLIAAAAAGAGWFGGRRRSQSSPKAEAPASELQRLEEYGFYPFTTDEAGHVHFDPDAFDTAVQHFLGQRNHRAAGELIVIGEQNLVRETFPTDRLGRYKALYALYDGDAVVHDNDEFLENYRRIVNQIGRSFPNTGIEILLHNLVNPSRSLVAIENAAVTGRSIGSGATNLVLDLKTRRQRGEDKVNYELNIGSRQFKCTTMPIFRQDYGLVGAICINIDTRFMREYVMQSEERLTAFFDNLLRTDFELGENILSRDEYTNALNGKRHFLDEAIRTGGGAQGRRLAAIFFSDIVGFTTLMGADEAETLRIVSTNEQIHRTALGQHRGHLIQELGDGMLVWFDSASNAVAAARDVQRAVSEDGRYQIRVGIHLGEVNRDGGKVLGDGVNIAARIQAEMGPGEIGISSVVFDNVRNKEGVSATLLGERMLKGVTDPVVLYSVDV
ncbi:MAG TPA: PAS domain-containing protein [Anaerolineales bacterium]|nr:PAS domain-containing protein [Anaerolineales bacterium]